MNRLFVILLVPLIITISEGRAAENSAAADKSSQIEKRFSKDILESILVESKGKLNSKANKGCTRETIGGYFASLLLFMTGTSSGETKEVFFKCDPMDKKPEIWEKYDCHFQISVKRNTTKATKGIRFVVANTDKGLDMDISTVACIHE